MAPRYSFCKITLPLSHLPTLVLMIGYPVFWIEMWVIRLPGGRTSWMAWGILGVCLLALVFNQYQHMVNVASQVVQTWRRQSLMMKVVIAGFCLLALSYLVIALYAAILPPHLSQELDAINYHIMLPRQHLIRHSFAHIPWSVPDLFLLPIDYALSPFWLATPLPNKLIQFLFFLGILGCVYHVVRLWSPLLKVRAWVAVLAVMACHIVAIQAGTAMLDLVILYCFLACVHSLWSKQIILAAIELSFFLWSKPLIAPSMFFISGILFLGYLLINRKWAVTELPLLDRSQWGMFGFTLLIVSLFIAGPQLIKSLYYTGTPIFPLGVGFYPHGCSYDPAHWQSIVNKAQSFLSLKDSYGHGRSLIDFIKHWWLIAVPEKGVNNSFDYPVGLVFLLVVGPFFIYLKNALLLRRLPLLSLFVILSWILWWFGSQQTRFLLIPICLMIMLVIALMPRVSKVFIFLVIMALGLETASLVNAHRTDWGKRGMNVLRDKDRKLVLLKPTNEDPLEVDFPDVAFASLPVNVNNDHSLYVITHWQGKQ